MTSSILTDNSLSLSLSLSVSLSFCLCLCLSFLSLFSLISFIHFSLSLSIISLFHSVSASVSHFSLISLSRISLSPLRHHSIQFNSKIISITLPYRKSTTGGFCTALARLNRLIVEI